MEVIGEIMGAVLLVTPERYPLLVAEGVRLTIEYGNASCTPLSYAAFAHLLVEDSLEDGARFSQMAMAVASRMGDRELLAKVIAIIECGVHIRTAPLRDRLDPLRLGYQEGVASGDFEWASYCGMAYCVHAYLCGTPLRGLSAEIREMCRACRGLHQELTARKVAALEQATMNLLGQGGQTVALQGEAFDERAARPVLEAAGDADGLRFIAQLRILLLGLFGDFRGVLEEIERSEAQISGARRFFIDERVLVPAALSCFMVAAEEAGERRAALVERGEGILAELRAAARRGVFNVAHHVALLEAVRCAIVGDDPWTTGKAYDDAVDAARAEGFVQDAAFACELAGRFWLVAGRDFIARGYLERAWRLYARWGAAAKVAQLERQHAGLLSRNAPMGALITTLQAPAVLLDAASLFKASRAITSSLTLQELPARLLSAVMETAGAQRGAFFIVREDTLVLSAAGSLSRGAVRVDGVPIERAGDRACLSVVRTVATTRSPLLLADARQAPQTSGDPYVVFRQTRSVLCAPVLSGSTLHGVLYLDNDLMTGAFTPERVEVVGILSGQAAITLENALLYDNLARLLDERTRLLAQAEEGVRARDVFLTIAAHELKTPLTPLRMAIEGLLGEGAAHKAATIHKLERAGRQLGRLERLVNDLLEVSSLAAGPPEMHLEDLDLSEIVHEVAEKHAMPLQHAGSTLLLKAEPGTLGRWDRARLSQIVEQLLSNAIKFGAGKPIDLQIEAVSDRARLVVRDRGPGIPPAMRERIFEAFARAASERHFGGLGLGLWIARRLVDALGGSIRVESELGAGAAFTVELPQAAGGAPKPRGSDEI
jgi:signal transduction histidine kinase